MPLVWWRMRAGRSHSLQSSARAVALLDNKRLVFCWFVRWVMSRMAVYRATLITLNVLFLFEVLPVAASNIEQLVVNHGTIPSGDVAWLEYLYVINSLVVLASSSLALLAVFLSDHRPVRQGLVRCLCVLTVSSGSIHAVVRHWHQVRARARAVCFSLTCPPGSSPWLPLGSWLAMYARRRMLRLVALTPCSSASRTLCPCCRGFPSSTPLH